MRPIDRRLGFPFFAALALQCSTGASPAQADAVTEWNAIMPATVTNMPDMKQAENVKAKGKIRGLKLNRETLRELDAGELMQAQGRKPTFYCFTDFHCTQGCGPKHTKKC